ncbi:hypothetical protein KOI40_00465 [Aestuariicella sp. G3-2]|uniref:hypothetical protein n=1 Tax=Pseudomaricurvus albidus TaxID=2842452 RepID=UPI001C0D9CA2|nr:hypothetical protein [Aestuariicella albida]MBU3068273.1 hypothetical protein [Aestuariicella albida]
MMIRQMVSCRTRHPYVGQGGNGGTKANDAVIDEIKVAYKLTLKIDFSEMQVDQRLVKLLPGMTVMAKVKKVSVA